MACVLLQLRVEAVLDGVVRATGKGLGDFTPFVAKLLMQLEDDPVLLLRPLLFADVGIQVIVPPLAALFANAARQRSRNSTPILSSMLLDHVPENFVFLPGPRALRYEGLVLKFEPAIEALDLGLSGHAFADLVPALVTKLVHIV